MKDTNFLVRMGLIRRNTTAPVLAQSPRPATQAQSVAAPSRAAVQSAAQPASTPPAHPQAPVHARQAMTEQPAQAVPQAAQPRATQSPNSHQAQPTMATAGQMASTASTAVQATARSTGLSEVLPARPIGADIGTVMPLAAKFSGDIEIEESIVFKCVVRGNVTQTGPHQVILTSTGGIHGTLRATMAIIAGTVEGDVYADELVVLETGKIEGNVRYCRLTVEEGGAINGDTRRVVANVVSDAEKAGDTNGVLPGGALQEPGGLHAVPRYDLPRHESQEQAA